MDTPSFRCVGSSSMQTVRRQKTEDGNEPTANTDEWGTKTRGMGSYFHDCPLSTHTSGFSGKCLFRAYLGRSVGDRNSLIKEHSQSIGRKRLHKQLKYRRLKVV